MSGLVLQDVEVRRNGVPVIGGVSLSVQRGAITTLVGPNGAGKTSLLESISGVIVPSAGSVSLEGTNLLKVSRRQRFALGMVHVEQGRTVFPSLSVEENIALTAASKESAAQVWDTFPELVKRRNSAAGLLSGGEQQMVVLARALAANPKYILIDEMSLGLAPVVFLRLLPIFREIADSGVGVLLVEQFAHLALNIADEAVVISSGSVTYQGPARSLVEEPARLEHAYLG